ncbi:hypothetical protein EGJ34_19475 [Stenotrophomonas sp. 278]|nr:hypothetical protein EGJ34_19475 [Stenotrophomonas sp. 278]
MILFNMLCPNTKFLTVPLTTTAAPFFEQLGFDRIAREVAPTFIAKSPQILGLCPGSAVLLTKPL